MFRCENPSCKIVVDGRPTRVVTATRVAHYFQCASEDDAGIEVGTGTEIAKEADLCEKCAHVATERGPSRVAPVNRKQIVRYDSKRDDTRSGFSGGY